MEIAKREGFVPFQARSHLWGQLRNEAASPDERLAAAYTIAELGRLFPNDISRYLNAGELALVSEVIRLHERGDTEEQIFRQAAANINYPDPKWILGAVAGARRPRISRRARPGGTEPHAIAAKGTAKFVRAFQRAFAGSGFQVRYEQFERELFEKHGIRRRMDLHIFDPVTSKSVIVRYEVKTNSGRKSENERRADKRLCEEGQAVHDVHVDLRKGKVKVDGQDAQVHFEALKQQLRRGR